MALILCDVDEVICPLHGEWFGRWNRRTGDTLRSEDHTRWNVHEFVNPDPEADVKPTDVFKVLRDPDLYEAIKEPVDGAVEGIQALKDMGHRVVYLTSGNPDTWGQKFYWLQRMGFLDHGSDYKDRYDYVPVTDKHLVLGDVFIDDGAHNLEGHNAPFKILLDKPYNQEVGDPDVMRVYDWPEIVELIEELQLPVAA